MAQEKNMNEKPKRTRKPKAKDEGLPVEQITELMLVHNKNDPKAGGQRNRRTRKGENCSGG